MPSLLHITLAVLVLLTAYAIVDWAIFLRRIARPGRREAALERFLLDDLPCLCDLNKVRMSPYAYSYDNHHGCDLCHDDPEARRASGRRARARWGM